MLRDKLNLEVGPTFDFRGNFKISLHISYFFLFVAIETESEAIETLSDFWGLLKRLHFALWENNFKNNFLYSLLEWQFCLPVVCQPFDNRLLRFGKQSNSWNWTENSRKSKLGELPSWTLLPNSNSRKHNFEKSQFLEGSLCSLFSKNCVFECSFPCL